MKKKRRGKAGFKVAIALGALAVLGVVFTAVLAGRNTVLRSPELDQPPGAEGPAIKLDEARVGRGKQVYEADCAGCHGRNGVGENPANPQAVDDKGRYLAPPLDGSAHAWHHADQELVDFISDGSPSNPRMRAWKAVLTPDQIRDVVEYMKSLWGPRELNCQGPRHMDPDCFRGH